MAVTIQMIETKEFRVKPTGYDPQEVDNFLDEIVDELERLQKENKTLKQEASRPRAATQSAASSQGSEETIRVMLSNAQRVCDDSVADAKRRADDIMREARREAEQIVSAAQEEDRLLNDQLTTMRDAVADYRSRFKKLVDEQMRLFRDDD